jgi:hypothetical protein
VGGPGLQVFPLTIFLQWKSPQGKPKHVRPTCCRHPFVSILSSVCLLPTHPQNHHHIIIYYIIYYLLFIIYCYSGQKRCHGLKYQGITLPNGLFASMFGPIEGRHHDAYLLHVSGIMGEFGFMINNGQIYSLYGDSAYPLMMNLINPHKNTVTGSPEAKFNERMSSVRVSNEWGFQMIGQLWQTVDFKRYARVFQNRFGRQYRVATLLTNCVSCVRGQNLTSMYFDCDVPELSDYLNGNW